jgi:hypothetical protein
MEELPEHLEKNESPASDPPESFSIKAGEWTEEMLAARRRALAELAAYDQEIGI